MDIKEFSILLVILALIAGLVTLAVNEGMNKNKTLDLLRKQGFIEVKYHGVDVWIKAQDAVLLIEEKTP